MTNRRDKRDAVSADGCAVKEKAVLLQLKGACIKAGQQVSATEARKLFSLETGDLQEIQGKSISRGGRGRPKRLYKIEDVLAIAIQKQGNANVKPKSRNGTGRKQKAHTKKREQKKNKQLGVRAVAVMQLRAIALDLVKKGLGLAKSKESKQWKVELPFYEPKTLFELVKCSPDEKLESDGGVFVKTVKATELFQCTVDEMRWHCKSEWACFTVSDKITIHYSRDTMAMTLSGSTTVEYEI